MDYYYYYFYNYYYYYGHVRTYYYAKSACILRVNKTIVKRWKIKEIYWQCKKTVIIMCFEIRPLILSNRVYKTKKKKYSKKPF